MQTRRSYQTVEESRQKFDELIVKLRKRGDLMLPPERELCQLLGCSRNTARKLLELKVAEGVVLKRNVGHTLSLQTAANRKVLGSFTFVARGLSMVENPAWAKLWLRLQSKAEAAGICAELVLIPFDLADFDFLAFERSLRESVVLTTVYKEIQDSLRSRSDKFIITTEEHYRGLFPNMVALDNYKAGLLAAKTLAERGYRRPAMICDSLVVDGTPYVQFIRRIEGFREGCRKYGLEFGDNSLLMVSGPGVRLMVSVTRRAMELAKGGFDSVFLHTDNDLEFLMEGFASEGVRVPDDIGVITLNSFDKAVSLNPPVTSVTHGTEPMADMLIEKLRWHFETGGTVFGECLVKPGIHEGRTLK
jgi:DNA-binding LacI/PurR family transcriptional regulator